MHYSTPKTRETQDSRQLADWTCSKCGFTNFKRREHCHKCNTSRNESERLKEGDGFDQVGTNPCNTLIFRGLDALTTEDNITSALSRVSALPIKNVKVIRDDLTATSRGYGFVEMNSLQEGTQLLETLHKLNNPLEVDGKAVIVSYAKNTFSTVLATMMAASSQQPYDSSQFPSQTADPATSASYEQGGYYDANGQWVAYDYSYYNADYDQGGGANQTDSTNAAAAVAQAAIQQAQAAKAQQKQQEEAQKKVLTRVQQHLVEGASSEEKLAHQAAEWTATSDTSDISNTKYPTPDVSTYTYDESSGYYYDASTGLYYDSSSQYYYNSQTGQFLYWDGEQQTYLPAPTDEAGGKQKADEDKGKKDKDKKEKVKVAKKIAKDMEKWAKSMNAQKEAIKETFRKTTINLGPGVNKLSEKESASADAGFAILEKTNTDRMSEPKVKDDKKLMPPPSLESGSAGSQGADGLVASYGGDSDSDDDDDDEEKLVDWNKMACLLCKRQFPSSEALQRHQQLSDLHKKNLQLRQQMRASESGRYRDRAKERRQKYGAPEPPLPRHKKNKPQQQPVVEFEQPTKAGIPETNVGSKLMQKMGWSQGKGLGRSNQGMVDPIEATRRQQSAGLGAKGSTVVPDLQPGDNYKTCVKKTMFARYHDLD